MFKRKPKVLTPQEMEEIRTKPPSDREGGVFSYQAYDQTLQDFCGHFMPPHRTAAIQTAP